jgi:hypothetical protein
MAAGAGGQLTIARALHQWWIEESSSAGAGRTLRRLMALLWLFVRESTPSRRRQAYGDVDYDWDFRVDTTSATVARRERLLGLFYSPYQPTDPGLFHQMLAKLNIDFREFMFIDIGSGKGRALLMAADYPFRRILGIELFPALHRVAEENIRRYTGDSQRCRKIESRCADARDFEFPPEPTVLYLFNPLSESGLRAMLGNVEISLRVHPRQVYLLYHNPLLEHVVTRRANVHNIAGTGQYSIFAWGDS